MKKTTYFILLAFLAVSVTLSAQERKDTLLTNFENNEVFFTGWVSGDLTIEVVDNPFPGDENNSDKVLKITGVDNHVEWAAMETPKNKDGLKMAINETTGYRYLHFKTYKDFSSKMLWSLYDGTDNFNYERYPYEVQNEKNNEWEYFVLDLLELNGPYNVVPGTYYTIKFHMTKNMNPRVAFTGYLDDVYLSDSPEKIVGVPSGLKSNQLHKKVSLTRLSNKNIQVNISSELKGNAKLDFYNMQGQLLKSVLNKHAGESFEIELPNSAFYVLRVTEGKEVYNIKF